MTSNAIELPDIPEELAQDCRESTIVPSPFETSANAIVALRECVEKHRATVDWYRGVKRGLDTHKDGKNLREKSKRTLQVVTPFTT